MQGVLRTKYPISVYTSKTVLRMISLSSYREILRSSAFSADHNSLRCLGYQCNGRNTGYAARKTARPDFGFWGVFSGGSAAIGPKMQERPFRNRVGLIFWGAIKTFKTTHFSRKRHGQTEPQSQKSESRQASSQQPGPQDQTQKDQNALVNTGAGALAGC